uniref:Ribonuclease H-like domain-containing protein n=1 Tax=Tanacetum cinerariifolium TaxID=118510 RepID=A0A6L2J471_TANCI|nr:ribonuclease H-like domain-containing protein [Tanacetum cinerariifolium]
MGRSGELFWYYSGGEGCTLSFGVDDVEDFKEYTLRDYYCCLKTYCCWVIDGVVRPVAPTTGEQILARKNELKARFSVVASVFATSTKVHVSALSNVDTLSDAVIYSFFASQSNSPQLDNDDLKQIDADDLEEMNLKWSPKDTRNKETQRRNVPVETSTSNALVLQCDEDIRLLKLNVMLRDNALVELRKKFKKAKQERDELKLKLENFQTYLKNLNVSMPASLVYDRYKSGEGYHVVPPPYTRTFMPPKPDLVFHDAPTVNKTVLTVFNVKPSPTKPNKDLSQSNRPSASIIEDWDCDYYEKKMVQRPIRNHAMRRNNHNYARMTHSQPHRHVFPTTVLTRSRLVPLTIARPVTAAVPQTKVQHQRPTNHGVNKAHSPIRSPINLRPSPTHSNFHQKDTTVKTTQGNPQHALKDKRVIDSRCSRHITWNISYLSDFEEINGGYVSFGENPKSGKITGKGKIRTGKLDFDDVYFVKELKFNLFSVSQMCDKKNIVLFTYIECIILSFDFKLPDDNHVLLRVPRENNMYNVDLKNIVPLGDLTCLFTKATLDESNLWHRRLSHINFKTMNKLV